MVRIRRLAAVLRWVDRRSVLGLAPGKGPPPHRPLYTTRIIRPLFGANATRPQHRLADPPLASCVCVTASRFARIVALSVDHRSPVNASTGGARAGRGSGRSVGSPRWRRIRCATRARLNQRDQSQAAATARTRQDVEAKRAPHQVGHRYPPGRRARGPLPASSPTPPFVVDGSRRLSGADATALDRCREGGEAAEGLRTGVMPTTKRP